MINGPDRRTRGLTITPNPSDEGRSAADPNQETDLEEASGGSAVYVVGWVSEPYGSCGEDP